MNSYQVQCILKLAANNADIKAKCEKIEKAAGITFEDAFRSEKDINVKMALFGLYIIKNAEYVLDKIPVLEKCAFEGFCDGIEKYAQRMAPPSWQIENAVGNPGVPNKWIGASGYVGDKLLGGGLKGTLGTTALYFIPGVSSVMTGIDAAADFANMFRRGATWKQRLGSGVSGLANLGFTAAGLIPGGSLVSGAVKGVSAGAKVAKGVKAGVQTAKGFRGFASAFPNAAVNFATSPVGKYLSKQTGWQQNLMNFAKSKPWYNPVGIGARVSASPIAHQMAGMAAGQAISGADDAAQSNEIARAKMLGIMGRYTMDAVQ